MHKLTGFENIIKNGPHNSIIVNCEYMEVHIPEYYFERKKAFMHNDTVMTFGFFKAICYLEFGTDLKKIPKDKIIKFENSDPNMIVTKPTSSINKIEVDGEIFRVLKYYKGDTYIMSTIRAQDSANVYDYVNMLLAGQLPKSIPYNKYIDLWLKCSDMNGVDFNIYYALFSLCAMVVARNPNNISQQFRKAIKENPDIDMHSMHLVNIDRIPQLVSQFAALTAGDPKRGLTSTIGAIRTGELKPSESEVEKLIK